MIIDGLAGTLSLEAGMGLLGGIYTLAVLIPGIAVTVRRLQDTNHSGWWLLIVLVPLIGAIVMLVFMVKDSQPGRISTVQVQRQLRYNRTKRPCVRSKTVEVPSRSTAMSPLQPMNRN